MPLPFFSSLCCPIAGSGIKSFFTGIDSSSDTAVSSTQLIYSFMYVFFYLFSYFFVIADIFFFKSIAWNLLSRIPYSVSVSVISFPCFSAAAPDSIRSTNPTKTWRAVSSRSTVFYPFFVGLEP